jgi:methylmalonyl-CoA/ethylmalonyl-CoA epimerase
MDKESHEFRMPGEQRSSVLHYQGLRNAGFEFLAPSPQHPNSREAQALAKRGDGWDHLSFTLPEEAFYACFTDLKEKGFMMVDEVARMDNFGIHYGYVHPKSTHRTLIELSHRCNFGTLTPGHGRAWDCKDDEWWAINTTAEQLVERTDPSKGYAEVAINHVAIMTQDINKTTKTFCTLLGYSENKVIAVSNFKDINDSAELRLIPIIAGNCWLVLLQPTKTDGAIAKSLAKKGEGIHHVGFSLPKNEFNNKVADLKQKGFRLIDEKPRQNSLGLEYFFVHPKSCYNCLIQFTRPWQVTSDGKFSLKDA